MSLTAFYAIDQECLDSSHWELADSLAQMHDLAGSGVKGVSRITTADLLLALEAWNHVGDSPEFRLHRDAVARIVSALGRSAGVAH